MNKAASKVVDPDAGEDVAETVADFKTVDVVEDDTLLLL